MELYDAGKIRKPSTSYEVQTFVEVPTRDEAEALALQWVAEAGGEALIFWRRTRPWLARVRIARFGSRR